MEDTEIVIASVTMDLDKGQHTVTLPVNDQLDSKGDFVALVERLDEAPDARIACEIPDQSVAQISQSPSIAAFVSQEASVVKDLTIRLWANTRQRIRITVMFLRKAVGKLRQQITCQTCKKLVEILLNAALAGIGLHFVSGTIALTQAQAAALQAFFAKGLLANLIAKYGLGKVAAMLLTVLQGLNWFFDLTDKLYESMCRAALLCP